MTCSADRPTNLGVHYARAAAPLGRLLNKGAQAGLFWVWYFGFGPACTTPEDQWQVVGVR